MMRRKIFKTFLSCKCFSSTIRLLDIWRVLVLVWKYLCRYLQKRMMRVEKRRNRKAHKPKILFSWKLIWSVKNHVTWCKYLCLKIVSLLSFKYCVSSRRALNCLYMKRWYLFSFSDTNVYTEEHNFCLSIYGGNERNFLAPAQGWKSSISNMENLFYYFSNASINLICDFCLLLVGRMVTEFIKAVTTYMGVWQNSRGNALLRVIMRFTKLINSGSVERIQNNQQQTQTMRLIIFFCDSCWCFWKE